MMMIVRYALMTLMKVVTIAMRAQVLVMVRCTTSIALLGLNSALLPLLQPSQT